MILNTRIQLKNDTVANWTTKNPILKKGEVAIVTGTDAAYKFKIGNGVSSFNQLSYVNEDYIKTNILSATTISSDIIKTKSLFQGTNVSGSNTSMANGIYLSVNGTFSHAEGIDASA